jgi:hypothetical protein
MAWSGPVLLLYSGLLDRVFLEYAITWLWVRGGSYYRLRVILGLDSINRLDRFVTTRVRFIFTVFESEWEKYTRFAGDH